MTCSVRWAQCTIDYYVKYIILFKFIVVVIMLLGTSGIYSLSSQESPADRCMPELPSHATISGILVFQGSYPEVLTSHETTVIRANLLWRASSPLRPENRLLWQDLELDLSVEHRHLTLQQAFLSSTSCCTLINQSGGGVSLKASRIVCRVLRLQQWTPQ